MGVSLYVLAVDTPDMGEDPVAVLSESGWQADQFGWAAMALAVGPSGIAMLDDRGARFDIGGVVSQQGLEAIVQAVRGVDATVIAGRFERGEFGEPYGAMPEPDEDQWLVEATSQLIAVITDAHANNQHLAWMMF